MFKRVHIRLALLPDNLAIVTLALFESGWLRLYLWFGKDPVKTLLNRRGAY